MRIILSLPFALALVVGLALLGVSLLPAEAVAALDIRPESVAALQDPALSFMALTVSAVALLFLVYAFLPGSARATSRSGNHTWGHVFQLAFSGSAALVATFLLASVIAAGGWIPGLRDSAGALGTLYATAVVQAGLGTVLAVALLSMKRASLHFAATLAVHVMECALLGAVLFVGTSA